MTRQEFDRLLTGRLNKIAAVPFATPEAEREAMEEAQLLDADGREFADAVDRANADSTKPPVAYERAVLVEGGGLTLVVTDDEWRDTPDYWLARVGKAERIVEGPKLVAHLRDGRTVDRPA